MTHIHFRHELNALNIRMQTLSKNYRFIFSFDRKNLYIVIPEMI